MTFSVYPAAASLTGIASSMDLSPVHQVTYSIVVAFMSYVVGEGIFGFSGVLSTVFAGIILGGSVWPSMVSKETTLNVWHSIEFMLNTVLFSLAGLIMGAELYHNAQPQWWNMVTKTEHGGYTWQEELGDPHVEGGIMNHKSNYSVSWEFNITKIDPIITGTDAGYLIAMYIFALIIRGVMLTILYYPLKYSGKYGTNVADVTFMCWGGLRGAVGLALA